MSNMIQVNNLTKYFSDVKAVDELSFTVNRGEVYGFLGQNGAGKSTTIRMLLSLVTPTNGKIEIFGLDLYLHRKEILKRTGAIIEKPDVYKYLTALENLKLFANMSGVRLKNNQLMEQLQKVGLADRANSKIKTYSQGMKQRLGIAIALVHDPDLIILDEPMNGLDPQGMADIRNLIIHLSKDLNKTIFISSHLLSEMEQVADSLLIIHKGKKIAEGKMHELLNPVMAAIEIETSNVKEMILRLKNTNWGSELKQTDTNKIGLQIKREEVPLLIKEVGQWDIPVYSIRNKHSLEDYFLSITSK